MKIIFYHRFYIPEDLKNAPGHYFYGATYLEKHNVDVIYLKDISGSRIKRELNVLYNLIWVQKSYDLIYGSTGNGLSLLVILKSLGLIKCPVIVWQHKALRSSNNYFIRKLLKFYYRGIDKLFMFTPKHKSESINTGIIEADKMIIIKWGPDICYYDKLIESSLVDKRKDFGTYYCSIGRENRDFPTLVRAFSFLPKYPLRIYTTRQHGQMNNEEILLKNEKLSPNVKVVFTDGSSLNNIKFANEVFNCTASLICCHKHNYSVGLTSLFDAMVLGKAIIVSDNPYFPFDIEKEKVGIKVPFGDSKGWIEAINYLSENKDVALQMGLNAKKLVVDYYNLEAMTRKIAGIFFDTVKD